MTFEKINHIYIDFILVYLDEKSFKFAGLACKLLSMETSNGISEFQLFDMKCALILHPNMNVQISKMGWQGSEETDYSDQRAADDI